MTEFRMPSLGADMESGTLVRWLVSTGDTIKRGDVIAEVETQKGVIDVDIFQDGVIQELLVPEGTEAPVGTPLALIAAEGEMAIERLPATPVVPEVVPMIPLAPPAAPEHLITVLHGTYPSRQPTRDGNGHGRVRVRATPAARKRAEELGIDLTSLHPDEPGRAITISVVEHAVHAKPIVPQAQSVTPVEPRAAIPTEARVADRLAAMRDAIAVAMTRSKREIPHYYLSTDIDMRRALDWLENENARRSVTDRILPAALLLKAVARACHSVPEINGFWIDGALQPSDVVHLGVAIALRGGGLVNPAIHNADALSLVETMVTLRDLVLRARGGKLRASELADATLTVTNLGDQGVGEVFGVIYPPQVALIGFGKIIERPVAIDGLIGVRPIVKATLSADHRASVGHRGSVFLAAIDALLQKPEEL